MKILLTAATLEEFAPLVEELRLAPIHPKGNLKGFYEGHVIEALISGVGSTITAYRLGKHLANNYYDLVINMGLAGSLNDRFDLGQVCHVAVEEFADLGAEDGKYFLDLFELGLMDSDEFPFIDGKLANPLDVKGTLLAEIPRATAITVNRVHGHEPSIKAIKAKYRADLESMEGAAVFYVCNCEKQAFTQIRSISNRVEKRNRDLWEIPKAIEQLNRFVLAYIQSL